VATQQLERLLSDPEMISVWASLAQNSTRAFNDVAAKFLLIELFERAAPVPPWQSESAKSQRRRLDQIVKLSERLRLLVAGSPLRHLSPDTLEEMLLDPRTVHSDTRIRNAGSSDFDEALKDLQEQAKSWREVNPLLQYPAREDAHRRYFIISVNRYLERNFCTGLHRELAVIAGIMLRDVEIDSEVVRKVLAPWRRQRGRARE
jgi:hypothetical protein